jgi:hypothetical protein
LWQYAASRKFASFILDEVSEFFYLPNPSNRIMVLGPIQPLTEMSSRKLTGDKGRPASKAGKLTTIC